MLMLSWYINSSILYLLLLGKKGSVNLTKRLPYSGGGGFGFFGGKRKSGIDFFACQNGKETFRRRRQFRQMPHMIWISDLPVKHEEAPGQKQMWGATQADYLRASGQQFPYLLK